MNNLKALRNTILDLKLPQDGDTIFPPPRIHLRHHDGNQAATCGQLGTGIRGNHHPGLNSDFFVLQLFQRCHFACQKLNLLAIDGGCKQHTYRAHVSLMPSCCPVILSLTSRTDLTHHAWLQTRESRCTLLVSLPQNIHTPSRNVACRTSLDDTEHGHSFLTYPESFPQRARNPRRSTATAEWRFGCAPTLHRARISAPRLQQQLSRLHDRSELGRLKKPKRSPHA